MNVNVNDITITSLETITLFDIVTGDFWCTLDELQNTSISQSQEKTDITGKQGRKLNSLKRNKAVTISGDNGLVSAGLLELQTGSNFEEKPTTVMWTDYLTVTENKAVTTYRAIGTEGNEIETVYVKNRNGTLGRALTQAPTADTADHFAYDPKTKTITFQADSVADGTELCVFYTRRIKANVLENRSDTYSGKCTMYVDAIGEDTCANVYRVQFYVPKADFEGNFELTMGDNQTVHHFEAEALAGACGTAGTYFTYTIFGAEDSDYVRGDERVSIPEKKAQPGGLTGKTVADLLEDNVAIAWDGVDGTVTGTLKKVTGWTEFSQDEAEGHYFPIALDAQYTGKPITVISPKRTKTESDLNWVLKVDESKKFTFQCDGETILTLDFNQATLAS